MDECAPLIKQVTPTGVIGNHTRKPQQQVRHPKLGNRVLGIALLTPILACRVGSVVLRAYSLRPVEDTIAREQHRYRPALRHDRRDRNHSVDVQLSRLHWNASASMG